MKLKYPALLALLSASFAAHSTEVFINEIHYDNVSGDVNEFIEVVAPTTTDVTGWTLVLYNGSSTQLKDYNTLSLSSATSSTSDGGAYTYYVVSPDSIQNGSPDGMALVDASGNVIQFLSYEGSFTAAEGAAAGLTSVDIGVEESGSTPEGYSLQLSADTAGSAYEDFVWQSEALATAGAANNDQLFANDDAVDDGDDDTGDDDTDGGDDATDGGDTSSVFINEIHYDNYSSDVNEGVELAGPAGTDLSGLSILLYNGNDGGVYNTEALSGVLPDQDNGYGTLSFAISGMQNGAPDGIALVNSDGSVIQFLSYEGSLTATDGAASGTTSVDIGVSETSSTEEGTSLQLVGTGTVYDDFSWSASSTDNFGSVNTDQFFSVSDDETDPEEGLDIGACFATDTTGLMYISSVQGNGTASPVDGEDVIIEGVVTATRSDGFFVQEETTDEDGDSTTSEGVYVFYSGDLPTVNNTVRLLGTVDEYYNLTEITNVTELLDCGAMNSGVTTVSVTLPLSESSDLEHYEGMMVSVSDLTVFDTNTLWQYGDLGLSTGLKQQPTDAYAPLTEGYYQLIEDNDADIIYIEDNTTSSYPDEISYFQDFSYANPIRVSDTVSATGPLNYTYSNYRINPVDEITVYSERDAAPTIDEGDVKIATFNVLNYFNGEVTDDGSVTFDYSDNRGAEDEEEFALQEARIVEAIVAMDADVVGLMEIENDGFGEDSAIQSLVDAINAQLSEDNQYSFVATEDGSLIGTDAIAVGLIYRPSVVTPSDDAIKIDMPSQLLADDASYQQMRVSLLQSFTHNDSAQDFALVVNHFKSKGSSCYEDSVDTTDLDTIQGSCNALRVSAAVALGDALAAADIPERVMILGDLNSYSAEDPLAVLTDYDPAERGYTITTSVRTYLDDTLLNDGEAVTVTDTYGYENVAEVFDADGFSYWYYDSMEIGSLDHILASPEFMDDIVDATHWSINSVEVYQLQYDQALAYYRDEDGYAFSDVGPYRSSDHDPFIVSVAFTSESEEGVTGDLNDDGVVDASDYYVFISSYGSSEGDERYIAAADMDANGVINISDFHAWYQVFAAR
jgi:predicted extracellular nuclease